MSGSDQRRPAVRADRNLFCTSDRLVKSSPSALCDRGEGFAVLVGTICQFVANRARKTFHNSELRAGEIGCLLKSALTGTTSLPVG